MVSDDQAAAGQVIVNDGQSHLLKLPGELRNRICDYALTSGDGFEIAEKGNSHKSGLLEACHQLRDETRLLYHEYNDFHIIVTINNIDIIRRWAATIHDDERRSIPGLEFQFRMKYVQLTRTKTDRQFKAIDKFHEIIKNLEQRRGTAIITNVFERPPWRN